ncbi:ABC transporter permease [Leadbetterella byssophila]|uniref:ABC transporter permease n=1 Tax=Leadbetterella byssophila TaxID=316068 RepID=UPI0039A1CA80
MNVNLQIARTYVFANKRLTAVAVLGVLIGMSIYIFMNCLAVGFDEVSYSSVFKSTPHIRLYQDDQISKPLVEGEEFVIINPKIVPTNNRILNPNSVKELALAHPEVNIVTLQVTSGVFFNSGKSQLSGTAIGIIPDEANQMFSLESMMVEGDWKGLQSNPNGILIGSGVAEKMSLKVGDILNLTSSKSVNKNLQVMGIFKTSNSKIDKSTAYVNLSSAQQLLKENGDYVTDVNINLHDYNKAVPVANELSATTGYKAEGFEQSNETLMTGNRMRKIVMVAISTTLLIVAGFGIYNILNMTVSQKINDIAILKAMGFKGKDVITIFVTQALGIGVMGVIGGMFFAVIMISLVKKVYIGGDIGYFPIDYEFSKFLQGAALGLVITFFAGYIPARKAAKVDPVSIFRK